jgi:hypothetical protein
VTSRDAYLGTVSGNTVTWTLTGAGKADTNDEEDYTLMANGKILTVDTERGHNEPTPAEIYDPSTGSWSDAATAPNILVDPASFETGPNVRLDSNSMFQVGGTPCSGPNCAAHTAIYRPALDAWVAGPDFPAIDGHFYNVNDGPASILPSGRVLIQASPGWSCGNAFCSPSHFFVFNGRTMVQVDDPAGADIAAYQGRMLVLPTGQILWTSDENAAEVFTETAPPNAKAIPRVTSAPATVTRGTGNYSATGRLFTGVSNGAAYGDDAQMNTDYPLVRITNNSSGHVCYARTHDFSPTTFQFDVPSATPPVWENPCDTGASTLAVVVNGVASALRAVTVD